MIAAVRDAVHGEVPMPDEVIEVRLAERFGWTFSQLDEEDEGRVRRAVALSNMADAYRAVLRAVETHQTNAVTQEQWAIYRAMIDEAME